MLYRDRRMVSGIVFMLSEGKLMSMVCRECNRFGKLGSGQVNFMYGVVGYANAQRTLDCIRTITPAVYL